MKYEDRAQILQLTDGGLNIFRAYLPNVTGGKNFLSPFYDDKKASCTIYQTRRGVWRYKDFGNGGSGGDAFWFVGKLFGYNLSTQFPKILAQIVQDLNLPLDITTQESLAKAPVRPQVSVSSSSPVKQTSWTDKYSIHPQPFTQSDIEFWGKYGINQDTLERYGVSSLASFSSYNRMGKPYQLHYRSTEPMYCYQLGDSVKIYRPHSKVRFLNAGVRSGDDLFGYAQLPSRGKCVLLTGGEKDVLSLASHGFPAFCLNSETAHLPKTLLQGLSDRFDMVGVLYDMDDTGVRQSQKIIEDNPDISNLFRVELPLSGSKSEKDVSDFFSQGGTATALQGVINQIVKQQGMNSNDLDVQRIDPRMYESDIRSRKLTGVQEAYYDNGQISRRKFYKDGLADGMGYSWHRNGQLADRCTYKAGKREGLSEEWYDNGQLKERATYKAGKPDGVFEYWHENGQLRQRTNLRAGERDGLSETWYPDGRQQTRWNYKDDKLDGLCELWDGGGNLLSQTHYKDNKKNGLHLDYDPESGEMYHWILFEDDLSIKSGKPEELEHLEANKNQTSKIVVPSSPVQEQAQAILSARGDNAPSARQQAEARPTQQQEYKHKL
ncbi:hypothetical protein [Porphyromonas sp.]|uniref:hypothetical protein n=1 Tax=Porphyromonas sp. TaxID=1924944 RepID=UPI003AB2DC31